MLLTTTTSKWERYYEDKRAQCPQGVSSGVITNKNHRFRIRHASTLSSRPPNLAAVLGPIKAEPYGWPRAARPALTAPARERLRFSVVGTEDARGRGSNKRLGFTKKHKLIGLT
jgi:hypothetical protein